MTGIPKYTKWDQVPKGLYTRTQLSKMDPPYRIRKDALIRGRALYRGNRYADLYAFDDAEPKPAPTPKQLAAALRAGELRYICRWCVHVDHELLPRRICDVCGRVVAAYRTHLQARACLGGIHQTPSVFPPLFAAYGFAEGQPYRPNRIVIVEPLLGGKVIADGKMPACVRTEDGSLTQAWLDEYNAAVDELLGHSAVMRRRVIGWKNGPWQFVQAGYEYVKWLGYIYPPAVAEMPGATGDLAADAQLLAGLVGDIAHGLIDPPDPSWTGRGITPKQMRPYVAYSPLDHLLEFVDALTAIGQAGQS